MKGDVKAFNRRKPFVGTDKLTARLDLRAESDYDGKVLAVLYRWKFFKEFPYIQDAINRAVGEITE